MKYKVLKEFLTVKNPRWLRYGEVIDGQPSGARIKALLEKKYIEEVPEPPKTVWDLEEGDECYAIETSYYGGPVAQKRYWSIVLQRERTLGLIAVTKEECEKKITWLLAKEILERDTKGFKPDWNDAKQEKVFVYYDYRSHHLTYLGRDKCNDGALLFANANDAQASINNHPNEWKTYLGVEE